MEDVSQNLHAYCVRAVRIIVFNFILHPPPPFYIEHFGTIIIFVPLTYINGGGKECAFIFVSLQQITRYNNLLIEVSGVNK